MEIWHKILQIALHAPSPHNVQPWRIKILDESRAELYIDSTRTLPKEDTTGSFIILTMGIFLEAVDILARREQLRIEYELAHPPEWYAPAILETKTPTLLPFARIELIKTDRSENPYDESLFLRRRTSRLSLLPEKVPPKVTETLKKLAAEFGQHYSEITDKETIEKVINRNIEAVFEDLNSPDYQEELVSWFRFSERESAEKLDGLDYRCMNTSRLNFRLSARAPWLLNLPLFRQILWREYRRQLGVVPTIGLLAGGFWKPADAINSGRCLMRFWLETAKHNLYIHPYGNLVTNPDAANWWNENIKIPETWLIFKIGYSAEPPKSHRLSLEKILVN
ncbi:MAG: hypothetical protein M3209_14360 [Acidobacteriota bacterium]|nr:hypothetical protein [Acidobacteriota bacterium]